MMMKRTTIRTYSELVTFTSFEDRFAYLKLEGIVGKETFGSDRYINQMLYRSKKWKRIRDEIIIRDNGCDLGVEGYNIYGRVIIHHMNPITKEDIEKETDYLYNPEFLISTTTSTHNAIHYGNEKLISKQPIERRKNDTCPWKHN